MSDSDPEAEEERTDSKQLGASRRKFMVAGGATWASVSLAGCLGGDDEDEDDDDEELERIEDDDDDEPEEDDDDEEEEEPDPEPSNYVVTDDLLAGSEGIPEQTGGFVSQCAPQRTFIPDMQAVFKIGIYDPETGDMVDDSVVDEATVELDTDDSVEIEWDEEDGEWSGSWMIPEDAEPETVGYTVEVTNEGEFHNVGVWESELEIIEYDSPEANYVVTTDLYTGSEGIPEDEAGGFATACSPQRTFAQGMMVGFEVGIYNGSTGELVDNDVVDEALIEVDRLDDPLELAWDDEDEEWGAAWDIPEDEEEGEVTFEVQVTNEDADFYRVGIQENSFPIIEYDE